MDNKSNLHSSEMEITNIFKLFETFLKKIKRLIFVFFHFFLKNIIAIIILSIFGIVLGNYLDKHNITYETKIIVQPNVNSSNYLYSKIDLIDSKIKENDREFIDSLKLSPNLNIAEIEIEAINSIYDFINQTPASGGGSNTNFELLKLFAEDGDVNKIIKDKITSKNYTNHTITIKTLNSTLSNQDVKNILDYLNNNSYLSSKLSLTRENLNQKYKNNISLLEQVDAILNTYGEDQRFTSKSKLLFYSENTQINDLLSTKTNILNNQASIKNDLLQLDKVIKPINEDYNMLLENSIYKRYIILLPILFILMFGILIYVLSYRTLKKH